MDAGVEHGRQPDPAGDAGQEPQGGYSGMHAPAPAPVYDDQPTTILDLRRAFAEAGPEDAPPLGVVTVQREHPFRAALAFLGVLALIAGAAGGLVLGIATVGKNLYEKSSAPPTCSAAQVANGTALADFLTDVASGAAGVTAEVVRAGCTTEGITDPLTGQSAALTVPAGKQTSAVAAVLAKKHECQFGQASQSGVRICSVPLGTRLAAVELRPAKDRKTSTFTVAFR